MFRFLPTRALVAAVKGVAGVAVGVALLAAGSGAAAQSAQNAEGEQVDRYLTARMQTLGIPGLQVAVVKDGDVVLLRSYGVASVELAAPSTDGTVFAINSITKAFTGVAAMRLVQQNRLDLSEPVSRYLDDLPEAWRGVTIRQLLSHMSGLPEITRAPTAETDAGAAWEWVQTQPIRFPAGDRFDYCQTNYALIQRVINALEGRAPDAPLAGEQLALASLENTPYGDSTELVPGKAPTYGYRYAVPGGEGVLYPRFERFLPYRRAASGMNSNAGDMARWIVALGTGRILDEASLERMWTPVPFNSGEAGQWGLGWQVLRRGDHRAVGMTGGGRAAFFIYPEDDVAVVVLTNLSGAYPEDFVDRIASIYAPDLKLSGVPALRIALDQGGYDQASSVAAALAGADPGLVWQEAELNDWGYRLLSSGRPAEGLEILKLVAELFPQSANAFDSLGEAYAISQDRTRAIASYRRSLELDPDNANAVARLAALERGGSE